MICQQTTSSVTRTEMLLTYFYRAGTFFRS